MNVHDLNIDINKVSVPESSMTVEEMVSYIYEFNVNRHNFKISSMIQQIRRETGESEKFIRHCIGKMLLVGITFHL